MSKPGGKDGADSRFASFETAIGFIAIVWTDAGVKRVCLPEEDEAALLARAGAGAERVPLEDAPDSVRRTADRLIAHVSGTPHDFLDVPLDLSGVSAFARRVYDRLRTVGPGRTVTYAELAAEVGSPGAMRAIGRAMASNPIPVIIPCHRVLAAGGRLGGFSAHGGATTKERLLYAEGVRRSLFPP